MKKEHIFIAIAIVVIGSGLLLLDKKNVTEEGNDISSPTTNTPSNTNTQNTSNKPTIVKPQESVPTIPSASSLIGSTLRLVSYNGTTLAPETKYSLSFADGTLSAKFCNSVSGSFILDGSLIKANNLATTLMYCSTPSNIMEIESAFISMLDSGATIYRSGGTIIISHASKGTVMVFSGF